MVARQAHNLEVACSSPASATQGARFNIIWILHHFCILGRKVSFFYILYKLSENRIERQERGIANENEAFPCTGHGYIELAVDDVAVLHESVFGEEIELIFLLYCEAIDDVVALTALIAFHGVDGYVVKNGYAIAVYRVAYCSNLVAIRYDNAYC